MVGKGVQSWTRRSHVVRPWRKHFVKEIAEEAWNRQKRKRHKDKKLPWNILRVTLKMKYIQDIGIK